MLRCVLPCGAVRCVVLCEVAVWFCLLCCSFCVLCVVFCMLCCVVISVASGSSIQHPKAVQVDPLKRKVSFAQQTSHVTSMT